MVVPLAVLLVLVFDGAEALGDELDPPGDAEPELLGDVEPPPGELILVLVSAAVPAVGAADCPAVLPWPDTFWLALLFWLVLALVFALLLVLVGVKLLLIVYGCCVGIGPHPASAAPTAAASTLTYFRIMAFLLGH